MVWEYLFNSQVSNILDTYPEVELLSSIRILFNFLKNHCTFKIYFKWKSDIIFFVWNLDIICALANNTVKKMESASHSVLSVSLQLHGLYSPWNFPGQNTGLGSPFLLQGIFPTQGQNQVSCTAGSSLPDGPQGR